MHVWLGVTSDISLNNVESLLFYFVLNYQQQYWTNPDFFYSLRGIFVGNFMFLKPRTLDILMQLATTWHPITYAPKNDRLSPRITHLFVN